MNNASILRWTLSFHGLRRDRLAEAALLCVALFVSGCSVVGPAAISNGRTAYNEAITDTNNQQILMIAIHNRYEETGSMLAVASVTANVRFTARTGIQLGFGDDDNYAGSLVPFSGGAVYEENPTISYTPVHGEKYARQVMSPVPLFVLGQLARTLVDPTRSRRHRHVMRSRRAPHSLGGSPA